VIDTYKDSSILNIMTEFKQLVLNLVKQIPKGRVVSYGDIANRIGGSPRTVGFIMTGLSAEESKQYPWHRVVDRNGFISSSKLGERGAVQEALLKAEGIEVIDYHIINKEKYWFRF
jgi:methylated-DNA-protein-cysteine methyltransferase related protein